MAVPIAAVMALVQAGIGVSQMIKANQINKNNPEPRFEISPEAKQALEIARAQANKSTIPAQAMYENQILRSEGSALTAARSSAQNPGQLTNAAIGINDNTNQSIEKLAAMGLQNQNVNIGKLQEMLRYMSGEKDKAFEINEMRPYLEKAGVASSLYGAGIQNTWNAVDGFGSNLLKKEMNKETLELLNLLKSGSGKQESMIDSLDGAGLDIDVPQLDYDYQELEQINNLIRNQMNEGLYNPWG